MRPGSHFEGVSNIAHNLKKRNLKIYYLQILKIFQEPPRKYKKKNASFSLIPDSLELLKIYLLKEFLMFSLPEILSVIP